MISKTLLDDLARDIVMRARVCTTLSDLMFQNIRAMEKVSGIPLETRLGFEELNYQVYQILQTARELEGEIEEES
nr:hypothetical protein [uncultured Shinella sp.]